MFGRPPRIALCGPLGCGKSATAHKLAELSGGLPMSLSAPLRAVADGMAAADGRSAPQRSDWQELSKYRAGDTWIKILDYNLRGRDHQALFVENLRFPDECEFLRERGFFLVRLQVSEMILYYRREERDGGQPTAEQMAHESEYYWPTLPVDAEVDGDDDLPTVVRKVIGKYYQWRADEYAFPFPACV